ncbi:hypothetical protein ACFOU2_15510 [Bacillus songklensis]|uniref:Uncharacterized protein n=1 Tax=Bacillus songklensis TaxID=1069116 RepID=A0ABV8B545_9BACI
MQNIVVKIGEHFASIYSKSERLIRWIQTYFQVIEWIPSLKTNSPYLLIHIEEGYGIPFVDYHVEIDSNPSGIIYRRADYFLEVNHDYSEASISVYDELALKHALHNLYSAFIIHNRWGLLIHSSCVEHQEKAYLFAGQSGAGKSTVARLSAPRPILSDEATLVKINENQVTVFDSPFRSELTSPYLPHSCNLSSIYLLVQSLDVRTSSLKKSDALLELMDKIFYWHHDSSETAKLLNMCKQLVEQVPVYRMHFQKNDTFWELIS